MDGHPHQGTRENQGTCELSTDSQTLGPLLGNTKILVCNASDIRLASWIEQGELGSILPCRFLSPKFSPAQLKYPTYQKKLLAIVDSLKFFEAQLRDHNFTVLTHYQTLLSFL